MSFKNLLGSKLGPSRGGGGGRGWGGGGEGGGGGVDKGGPKLQIRSSGGGGDKSCIA